MLRTRGSGLSLGWTAWAWMRGAALEVCMPAF
jgi:hypothetical protein